jgi:hypothetical protein
VCPYSTNSTQQKCVQATETFKYKIFRCNRWRYHFSVLDKKFGQCICSSMRWTCKSVEAFCTWSVIMKKESSWNDRSHHYQRPECTSVTKSGNNDVRQGCQMVCFQTKNPNLGKFWRALDWKMFYILWPFGIFYGDLGYFMTIWYILYSFGTFFRFW